MPSHYRLTNRIAFVLAILVAGLPFSSVAQESATGQSAADFLPSSCVIYAELARPAETIDDLLNHPVTQFVQEQEEFKELLARPDVVKGLAGLKLFESQTGEPVQETLKMHFGRGLAIGFDKKAKAPILLFRSNDETNLKQLAGKILSFIDNSGGNVERKPYRNAKAASIDELVIARYEDWFLASNNQRLVKETIDRLHGDNKSTLAQQDWFVEASKKRDRNADAWATIDLNAIRMAGVAKELFAGKTNEPGAELLLGAAYDTLKNAPYAAAQFYLDEDVRLEFSSPFQSEWTSEARKFFFGSAPRHLAPKNMIASVSAYRDLGQWWLSKEELFDESVVAGLAQADSQFSTIFSGLDFGEEVLANIKPGMQLIVTENTYASETEPDVKIPAFAMVSELNEESNLQKRFKIAFQSAIGFANINLGMTGQPQLELESEKIGNTRVSSATYMFDDDVDSGMLLLNFGPTIAFNNTHFILSSNRELAIELAGLAELAQSQSLSEQTLPGGKNTSIQVNGNNLQQVLEQNRESLIANNMLEEGNSREDAESEIELLLRGAKLVRELKIDFANEPDQMKLTIEISPNVK